MMKTGLLFGSFNPVHVGHMVIANYMLEFTDLDRIWFVVTPHNPLKKKSTLLPDHHRLQLVNLAIGENPKMKPSDIEFKLPQPNYTTHTLAYLKEKYPKQEFSLIMGSDNIVTLHKWKNFEWILENYDIYVYPRPGDGKLPYSDNPRVKITNAPLMDVSSSFIREGIKGKKDVRYFMPEAVSKYIKEMHFYEK
jgi:nicotinate-nucleotide adenylyltransferase